MSESFVIFLLGAATTMAGAWFGSWATASYAIEQSKLHRRINASELKLKSCYGPMIGLIGELQAAVGNFDAINSTMESMHSDDKSDSIAIHIELLKKNLEAMEQIVAEILMLYRYNYWFLTEEIAAWYQPFFRISCVLKQMERPSSVLIPYLQETMQSINFDNVAARLNAERTKIEKEIADLETYGEIQESPAHAP